MTELDAQLARRELTTITRNLDLLGAVDGITLADYRADPFRRKGTERLLQEIVEAAVDLNLHLLRAVAAVTPADYYQVSSTWGVTTSWLSHWPTRWRPPPVSATAWCTSTTS